MVFNMLMLQAEIVAFALSTDIRTRVINRTHKGMLFNGSRQSGAADRRGGRGFY